MTTEIKELKRCSDCKCNKLLKFFKTRESTGLLYKTCIKCCEKCKKCPCGKQPCFGFENDKKATCCKDCKKEGMINIRDKKCPCGKQPCFGFEGDEKATCCKNCKEDGMLDIKHKKCICGKRPHFGFEGDKKATCCKNCKEDGMIDILSKRCPCGKRPNFGFEGDEKATCCKDCKKDTMIDLNHKKCICGKRPHFGFEGDKKATCCKNCKEDGMIDILSKNCPCGKRPHFGFEGYKKATCCSGCKKDGMINIVDKRCKTHLCDIQVKRKYKGYCSRCFFFTFPGEKLTRNYKTKENTIVDNIKSKFTEYDWIHDRKIKDGCSKKRPDLCVDFGSHVLIIEVDENSHQGYNCEEKRMMELINDLGMRPTIFVRFNPDKYIDEKTNKTIQSLFVVKKDTGKLEIKNNKEFDKRIDKLYEKVEYYSEDRDYKLFQVEELYFR